MKETSVVRDSSTINGNQLLPISPKVCFLLFVLEMWLSVSEFIMFYVQMWCDAFEVINIAYSIMHYKFKDFVTYSALLLFLLTSKHPNNQLEQGLSYDSPRHCTVWIYLKWMFPYIFYCLWSINYDPFHALEKNLFLKLHGLIPHYSRGLGKIFHKTICSSQWVTFVLYSQCWGVTLEM